MECWRFLILPFVVCISLFIQNIQRMNCKGTNIIYWWIFIKIAFFSKFQLSNCEPKKCSDAVLLFTTGKCSFSRYWKNERSDISRKPIYLIDDHNSLLNLQNKVSFYLKINFSVFDAMVRKKVFIIVMELYDASLSLKLSLCLRVYGLFHFFYHVSLHMFF